MIIDAPSDFWSQLERLKDKANSGDTHAHQVRVRALAQLKLLQALTGEPAKESPSMKRVQQSKRYPVWRLSHPFVPDLAVRTIVWFPESGKAVVALFFGDKAPIGDAFYNSVGSRADVAIDKYLFEMQGESDGEN